MRPFLNLEPYRTPEPCQVPTAATNWAAAKELVLRYHNVMCSNIVMLAAWFPYNVHYSFSLGLGLDFRSLSFSSSLILLSWVPNG